MTIKVLLTGFEPFGGATDNPSMAIAKALDGYTEEDFLVRSKILPVERYTSVNVALECVKDFEPDIVIALGVAGGRAQITPEKVAINFDDFRIADNAGNQPVGALFAEEAPTAYFSTLPINAMTSAMLQNEIPAGVSFTAGTFVCNHLMFGLLDNIEKNNLPIRAGFVHIPQAAEFAVHEAELTLPLDVMIQGVKQCIATSAIVKEDIQVIAGDVS